MTVSKASKFGIALLGTTALITAGAIVARGEPSEIVGESAYAPDSEVRAATGQAVYSKTTDVIRSVQDPPGEVRWTWVSYGSSDGPCLDLVAEQLPRGDEGRLSGCGTPDADDDPFRWLVGGVELGGRWYNVVYGTGLAQASTVRVTLADGATPQVQVARGVWLVAIPDRDPSSFEVERIEQVDPAGDALAAVRPTSVAALQQAQGPPSLESRAQRGH